MTNRLTLITAVSLSILAAAAPCFATQPITVDIVNESGQQPDEVFLLLTADPDKPITVSGISPNVPTKLSALTNHQFTLTAISAGRIFFSYNAPVTGAEPPSATTRYDKVELTYPGAANLTAVDFFGIPFKLEALDDADNVLQALNFYSSAHSLIGVLEALAPNALVTADGKPTGPFVRILSPTLSPVSYPITQIKQYVKSVTNQTVTIAGTYVGPVGPSPNTFDYSGTFGSDGTITLSGTMSGAATPDSQPLTVDGATLAAAIFTNNGPYAVTNATNNPQAVSNNDVYAAIYRDLVAGFDFGFVDGKYGSNSASWYGTTPYNPPFACARKEPDGYFNQYASLIAANSDAYGFPFSDVLSLVQVGLNAGGTGEVATLRITILPDNTLDAPKVQSTSSTNDSITLAWNAVTGATNYTVNISPPLPARAIPAGTSTSTTINNLNPGTPYTVAVVASNDSASSEAIPVIISTDGSVNPVTGPVTWHFIPNFTGKFPYGHTITFNGVSKPLPTTPNPAIQFNNNSGQPGQQNAYVFEWTDQNNHPVFSTILYVTLESSPTTGNGSINQAATATFMAANQHRPTYQPNVAFNLFASIAPYAQRTVCTSGLLGDTHDSPTEFGASDYLKVRPVKHGRQLRLEGTATDADGLRGISVAAVTGDGEKRNYPARLIGRHRWKTTVRCFGNTGTLLVDVIAVDKIGNVAGTTYYIEVP